MSIPVIRASKASPRTVAFFSDNRSLVLALNRCLDPDYVVVQHDYLRQSEVPTPTSIDGDIVFMDLDAIEEDADATDLLREALQWKLPVFLVASDDLRSRATKMLSLGARGYIRNPPSVRELRGLLEGLEQSGLHDKTRRCLGTPDVPLDIPGLIGSSPAMKAVSNLIRKVCNLDVSVLIQGESGTGKELIARAIHSSGKRSRRPFVAVSCSAIPDTLIESELFGSEKGSYTGSSATREGYFEQVGDGTLFLDEIGELKPQTQVKLLRVLQQREFSRLGSSRLIPLKARIVFATHRDLKALVASGEFRQDFMYRVSVMEIEAPPLRVRSSDIEFLAEHFLAKVQENTGLPIENIAPEAMAMLRRYSWPGNVRELENAVQRATIMAEGYSIEPCDLPEEIQSAGTVKINRERITPSTFEQLLRDYKYRLAQESVEICQGNKTLAAQRLSISRAYMHRLLRLDFGHEEETISEPEAEPSNVAFAMAS